ncbi:MAG: hypothetical protein ACFFB0_16030 [Promethearchaeota archaeon]
MNGREVKNLQIPDDIDFLLDLCRDLIRIFKKCNPNKDLPINREQIAKLRNIEKNIH